MNEAKQNCVPNCKSGLDVSHWVFDLAQDSSLPEIGNLGCALPNHWFKQSMHWPCAKKTQFLIDLSICLSMILGSDCCPRCEGRRLR
uniref:Uncharacterized protein n=1 Tax=Panagrellus redivivus TaxID=6233 RepID=A0A7E4ULX7_PANRE